MEINRILIANRGEIAVRIAKAAKDSGISSLAIYSDLDGKEALHCRMADMAIPMNGSGLHETYLDIKKIISIARQYEAEAIHPGYGFLSENPLFAKACERNNIVFIGPGSDLIRLMGNKIEARNIVSGMGIPVIGGNMGSGEVLMEKAEGLKYPLLVKAAAGGGGKGMRIVNSPGELPSAMETTSREAENYFGDGEIFIEPYIDPARHIEFQVLGDHHGNFIHLYERECSIQRRYQKIIEESPSAWLKPDARQRMAEAALKITRDLGYTSAGTIEFLVDKDQDFYFLEMNTRIQVEHPVTEMVSGIDLVKEQIRIAQGLPLGIKQEDVRIKGHSIETRLYAEDPANEFIPSPGFVSLYKESTNKNVRMDSSMDKPGMIFPEYDPMISKLIVWGKDREEAIGLLAEGLAETSIIGIKTNQNFLQEILQDEDFIRNKISTQYCDKRLNHLIAELKDKTDKSDRHFNISAFLAATFQDQLPEQAVNSPSEAWQSIGYWRQSNYFNFTLNGENIGLKLEILSRENIEFTYEEQLNRISDIELYEGELDFLLNGKKQKAFYALLPDGVEIIDYKGFKTVFRRKDSLPEKPVLSDFSDSGKHNDSMIVSPIYGKIIKINVKEKDRVKKGDVLLAIDSMKIENNIIAPRNGKIEKIIVQSGDQVEVNKPLLLIE